jgi:hypothetical protein
MRRDAGRAALRCSVLLAARLAVPSPSPAPRWALTPPFHPHRRPCGPSVCSSLAFACELPTPDPRTSGSMFSVALSVAPAPFSTRAPGSYPALRSREPGLSSPPARRGRSGGAARPKSTLPNPPPIRPSRPRPPRRRTNPLHLPPRSLRGRTGSRIRYRRIAARTAPLFLDSTAPASNKGRK